MVWRVTSRIVPLKPEKSPLKAMPPCPFLIISPVPRHTPRNMALQVDVLMYWSGSPVTVSLTFWSVFVTGGVVDAITKKPLRLFAAVSDEQQSISASLAQTTSRRCGKLFIVLPKQSVTLRSER